MHNPAFTLDIRVECTRQSFLEFRPPHMWRLLACIEQCSDDFIRLANIDGMNTHSFVMFDKALEGFTSIIRALKSLNLCLGSVIS